MRQKQPPTERLHFTCEQLQLFTSNISPRNSGTLLMRCVTASGVPDSSRRHPEATHEVFSWTRSCEPATQKSPKIANAFQFTRGSLVRWLHHWWKNGFYHEFTVNQADDITLLDSYPKSLLAKYVIPVRGGKLLSPKKAKKGQRSSWFLFICIIFSETSKYGSWL